MATTPATKGTSGDGTEAGAASWVVDLIDPMISESDNDAAESAWLSMGGEAAAAKAVNEVLGDGGDARTQFDAWVPPGDVQWELSDQAAFGANLTCIDGAKPVVEGDGEIVDYQSYGLGEIDGARFKGGWGPDYDGGYLSRQFGVIGLRRRHRRGHRRPPGRRHRRHRTGDARRHRPRADGAHAPRRGLRNCAGDV